ncbi:alpha-N-acetylgalactosaminide alpha-2,6-sialyltransferase 2-like isoform X1 [Branchiostoma floridae x Branchiostoma japonicum]
MWRALYQSSRRWIQLCVALVLLVYLFITIRVGKSIIMKVLPRGIRADAMRTTTILRPEYQNQSQTAENQFWGDLGGDALQMMIPVLADWSPCVDLPLTKDPRHRISECPSSLRQKVNTSAWFRGRFVEGVKLFMDLDDVDPAYWMAHMSYNKLPFGYQDENKTAVERMVRALKNPDIFGPSVTEDTRRRCIRCAVVGSGGVLKGSKRGAEIDAHDYVFRVNHAHMQKFAEDVGRETSFYAFYPESYHQGDPILAVSDALQLFIPCKGFDIDYMVGWLTERRILLLIQECGEKVCKHRFPLNPNVNETTVKVLHPEFIRYAFSHYLNSSRANRPTTGFLTVLLALQLCDHVSVYGFGYDARFPLYYYDDARRSFDEMKSSNHYTTDELNTWNTLHEEGIIYWYNGQNETLDTFTGH